MFEYDDSGRRIKKTKFDASDTIIGSWVYIYNDNGERTEEKEFNSLGLVIIHTYFSEDGSGRISSWLEIEYDEYRNRIREIRFIESDFFDVIRELIYSSSNIYIGKIETHYNSDSRPTEAEEYDSSDNLIKKTVYNEDGSQKERFEYEYNSDGKLVLELQYNVNNVIIRRTEWSYSGRGEMTGYRVTESDSRGNTARIVNYYPDGRVRWVEYPPSPTTVPPTQSTTPPTNNGDDGNTETPETPDDPPPPPPVIVTGCQNPDLHELLPYFEPIYFLEDGTSVYTPGDKVIIERHVYRRCGSCLAFIVYYTNGLPDRTVHYP